MKLIRGPNKASFVALLMLTFVLIFAFVVIKNEESGCFTLKTFIIDIQHCKGTDENKVLSQGKKSETQQS